MSINAKEMLNQMIKEMKESEYIRLEAIPDINLYMDQVTTFMDEHLAKSRRHPDDKILTKTMINNYAKNRLLPPPEKKKYSKEHMLLLIFIYYFKGILSISDIQTLLGPLTERFFAGSAGALTLADIYQEVFSLERPQIEKLCLDVQEKYAMSTTIFTDVPEEEQEELQFFALICLLGFDVYMKKQMIERMLDQACASREAAQETASSSRQKSDSRSRSHSRQKDVSGEQDLS